MNASGKFLFVIILLCGQWVFTAIGAQSRGATSDTVPAWLTGALQKSSFAKQYELAKWIKPIIQNGDFNGDGVGDVALLIVEKSTKRKGVLIVHGKTGRLDFLGAGHKLGNGGDDFAWMDKWEVYKKNRIRRSVNETPPPTMVGDGLLLTKSEAASGLVYWDGKRYQWYQQGD